MFSPLVRYTVNTKREYAIGVLQQLLEMMLRCHNSEGNTVALMQALERVFDGETI